MRAAQTSPKQEINGESDGLRASSPASIPALGIKQKSAIAVSKANAAFPNSAFMAPKYPPPRLPVNRKSRHMRKKSADESSTGRKKLSIPKKRTSSAPDKKPAPMHEPTIKNVPRTIPIFHFTPQIAKLRQDNQFFCFFMSDIVLYLLTKIKKDSIIIPNQQRRTRHERRRAGIRRERRRIR